MKGISPLMATVLLIIFTIIVSATISIWLTSFDNSTPERDKNIAFCDGLANELNGSVKWTGGTGDCNICWKSEGDCKQINDRKYCVHGSENEVCKLYEKK